jgi:tetratricopeptide (TPR) repeat protein
MLLVLVGVELAGLTFKLTRPASPELPTVDLTLLGDRIAVETLTRMQQQTDRGDPADWKRLGEYYLTYGYYPQAEMCFRVAWRMAPQDERLLLLQAASLDRMGHKPEAIDQYRLAIQRNVRDAESYRIRIAHCLFAVGDDEAAEFELQEMKGSPEARLLLSRVLIRTGRAREAQIILQELLREFDGAIEPHSMACWAAEELGEWETADRQQDRALRAVGNIVHNPLFRQEDIDRRQRHSNKVFHDRSIELEGAGRIEEAREACRESIRVMWEADMVLSFALFEIHLGNAHSSIQLLQGSIERVGSSPTSLDALGDAWKLDGDTAKAKDAWLRATEMHAGAATHDKLAHSFEETGNQSRAQWHRGLADYERGKVSWFENRLLESSDYFWSATQQAADYPPAWYYLAETYRLRGAEDKARDAYQQCLKLDPNHGRARRALKVTR